MATVGGYHPHFKKPDYYPAVKRLQFSWPMYPMVEAKGTIYFALTPVAVMAGGLFELSWDGGGFLYAYLKVGADFLIVWKPLHYEAEMFIEIGVSAHIGGLKVSGSIGADLSIWGPEFAGRAEFHFLGIIKFHITFGAGKPEPPPLSWEEFKESFLPQPETKPKQVAEDQTETGTDDQAKEVAKDKLLSFAVVDGSLKQIN